MTSGEHNTSKSRAVGTRIAVIAIVALLNAVAYITNPKDVTPYGDSSQTTTTIPEIVDETLTDVEGNIYRTVKIGGQVWMAENLRTTKYNDGTEIKLVTGGWGFTTNPEFCWYGYDPANKETYGALYNWYVVDTGKLAPDGWHVPTEADWNALADYLGGAGIAGGKLKEEGTAHWKSPNVGATNGYNFTMLPSGTQNYDGYTFYGSGECARLWSADEFDSTEAWARGMEWDGAALAAFHAYKTYGRSVRLVKNSGS